MPHALLLSPDDQAVSAITGVLEEMSVTCERPLDGVSAAQKLSSQTFDLVLVDCENLPAAKLIFDVCRRGKNGHNPVPIAIVDGRAGLPTAFRLGAELILTKPVAKDQARTTIRSAVGRVRKDGPTNETVGAPTTNAALPSAVAREEQAHAAAASVSSQLTSYEDAASSFVPVPAAGAASTATLAAALGAKMQPARHEVGVPSQASSSSFSADASVGVIDPEAPAVLSGTTPISAEQKAKRPLMPSDDPVLAEIERTEQEDSELAESKLDAAKLEISEPKKAAATQPPVKSEAPVFSSYQGGPKKTRGSLVALFVLALAGGGLYAAWMYQPGFRAVAQPQVDRVLALAGLAQPAQSVSPVAVPNVPKPAAPVAAATGVATGITTTDPNQTQTTPTSQDAAPTITSASTAGSNLGAPAATVPPTTSVATNVPASSAAQPVPTPWVGKVETAKSSVSKSSVSKSDDSKSNVSKPGDIKKEAAATAASDAPLPGESSAIILSSKGAEKRLAHSIQPKYPVEATGGSQGTVVLKEIVDETGKVEGVRLVEGDATLAAAAIKAVKQWHYRPYLRDGKALPFQTVVIIDFQRP